MAGTGRPTRRVSTRVQLHGCGPGAAFRFRATGLVLLVAHLLYVGWTALRPPALPWETAAHLRPLATIRSELALGAWPAFQHLGGAVLLLAPLGVLLPWATGRLHGSLPGSLTRTAFAGVMVSLGLALLQTNVSGRPLDVDSLMLHVVGIALAHLTLVPALRAWLRRHDRRPEAAPPARPTRRGRLREDVSQGVTPTIPRVGVVP